MEYIKSHINNEMNKQKSIFLNTNISKEAINSEKKQIKEDFKIWLENIRISMHLCKYRQVINEIESKKHNFDGIPEEHWKYKSIEIDAIFKLLKKKFNNHPKEIAKENSHQNHSCMFWINQIFLILEQLILEFRPDLNKIDYNDISIMKPIECIIEGHIKLIFCLIIFSQYNHQIPEICTYLSIINRFIPFMNFTTHSNSYIYFQKIQLLKAKLYIENCDYSNAREVLEKNLDFCCKYIKLLGDEDFNIYYFDNYSRINTNYLDSLNNQAYYNNTSNKEIKSSRKNNNQKDNISNLKNNIKIINNYKKSDSNLIINNSSRMSFKKNISKKESLSNIKENNIKNINTIEKQESSKIFQIKNLQINKKESELETKNDLFITQIQRTKRMDPHNKKVIEEIIENIALNFYLRGTIFEHLGNIESTLDSYKVLEWFSSKFLKKKLPHLAKYMSSLLKSTINIYDIITIIRKEKEKKKNINNLLRNLDTSKNNEKLKKNNKNSLFNFRFNHQNNDKKLKNYLDNLVKELYKEEEIRNFNLFSKFTKTGYILSTFKMIDNLLSKDFKHVLKQMKKIEITKPDENIKALINKAIIKKRQKSIEIETINNTKESTMPMINDINKKENNMTLDSRNYRNFNLKKKNLISLNKTLKRRNNDKKDNNFFHFLDHSNKKYSLSCKNSDKFKEKINFNSIGSKITFKSSNDSSSRCANKFHSNIFNLKKFNITKINSRIKSSRSNNNKEKVERYPMDKENFSKEFIQKKYFLDKYCNKELKFQKNLLKTKSYDLEFIKQPDVFDIKKVIKDAELNFNIKYEIAKSSRGKKNLNNLKKNYNLINNKLKIFII